MNGCDDLREYLAAWADGELDETTRERVRKHLDACAECRRELAGLERVDALFRAAAVPEVEAREWGRVEAALDEAMSTAPVSIEALRERPARRGLLGWWLFPAAAVAAAAIIVAVFLFSPAAPPPEPSAEVTLIETGPGYDFGVTPPAKDDDFLIIDVTNGN